MQVEKEKAHLSVEMLSGLAPCVDNANANFAAFGELLNVYTKMVDAFKDLEPEKINIFMEFMDLFNAHINTMMQAHKDLSDFYIHLKDKSQTLVDAYQIAASNSSKTA